MGRRVMIVVFGLIISVAAVVLAWMPVRKSYAERTALEAEILQFEQRRELAGQELLEKHTAMARWYNHALTGNNVPRQELETAYPQIGMLGQGAIGVIAVPELEWEIPVYHGGETGRKGAVHDPSTHYPLGIPGQVSGFTVTREWDLEMLEAGMDVELNFLGDRLAYRAADRGAEYSWVLIDPSGEKAVSIAPERMQSSDISREEDALRWGLMGLLGAWALPVAGEICRICSFIGRCRKSKKRKNPSYI